MTRRNSAAGGFFLTAAIMIGLAAGIWQGQLVIGLITGTSIGVAAAVATWLIDRRR